MFHRYLHLPFLGIAADVSCFLPVFVGWIWWKNNSRPMRIFLALPTYYLLIWLPNLYLITHYRNSLWITHITALLEYSITAFVFSLWCKNRVAGRVIGASIPIFLIISIIANVSFEKITSSGTFTVPLEGILLASAGVYMLIELIDEHEIELIRDPRFFLSVSVIVYGLGTAPFFTIYNSLSMISRDMAFRVAGVNWVLSIVANALYAIAFVADRASNKPEQQPKVSAES